MAELTVKFKTSGFSSAARSLGRSFDTRYNDYQGIRKKVLNESTSRSYLNSSGSYLQKKMDSLDSKRDKLKAFKTKVEDFCDEAKRVDRGVASRVKRDAKDVYKTLGIKTGFIATIATFFKKAGKAIWNGLNDAWKYIKDKAKNVWQAVKEWYEKNKKIILTVLAVIGVVVVIASLAVFAPGILLFLGKAILTIVEVIATKALFYRAINLATDACAMLLHWLSGKKAVFGRRSFDAATWGKEPGTISPGEYARLAQLAYVDTKFDDSDNLEFAQLYRRLYKEGKIKTVTSPSGFACTIIELDKDHAIVTFRGSEPSDLRDWVVDGVSITTGFNLQAEDAKRLINRLPYKNIQVTGHSLGGYLAIEAALSCDKVTECVVFNALVRNNAGGLFNKNTSKITQYRTSKDVASSPYLGRQIGKVITIPYSGWDPLKAHEIENFIKAFP